MAGVLVDVNSAEVALSAGVAKTVLQITAASNHRVKILGVAIYGKGIVVTDTPIKFRILRQTTAGTMTGGTAGTHISKHNDSDDETVQTACAINATAEPTAGDVLEFGEFHPQTGLRWYPPDGKEIIVKGGGRLGIELTAAQAQTVVAGLLLDE